MYPLAALLSAGFLAPYLLPTLVGRIGSDFALTPTQAGAMGSALLLASALSGISLAGRVSSIGTVRLARAGLLLLIGGFALAAAASAGELPLLLLGCVLGGAGSGTATAVAASGISAERDPHRITVLGLLASSTIAAALYLTLPHIGGGHRLPFACISAWGAIALAVSSRLGTGSTVRRTPTRRTAALAALRGRAPGFTLAGCLLLWSMAQNALWGVSGRIGVQRAGLSESAVGLVFALALGAGLLGTAAAGTLGNRVGRSLPIGLGTAAIACCVALSSSAHGPVAFAVGEIAWNGVYPFVLSYLLSLAARLDRGGRWAVLVGSASSLGVAGGPLAGTLISVHAGFTAMGLVLAAVLLLVALPMAAVARGAEVTAGALPPIRPEAVPAR